MASTVIGLDITSGIKVVTSVLDPTINDYSYNQGRVKWINTLTNDIFELLDNTVNNAIWKKTTSSSSSDYITVVIDPFNSTTFTDLDSSTSNGIRWEVVMSDNTSESIVMWMVRVVNDENSQDFTIESEENGSNNLGCDITVVFPSSGNATLRVKVTDADWRVVSKRFDI